MAEPALLSVLIGPPGAGKSTYARATFPAECIVTADEIRERVTGWRREDPAATWRNPPALRVGVGRAIGAEIERRLRAGLRTAYDNTNVRKGNRESLLALVPPGVHVAYLVFDRPLAAKLASRDWRPAELIEAQHELFLSELPDILAGDGRPFVSVEDLRVKD